MQDVFTLDVLLGFAIAYAVVSLVMFVLNKREAKLDVKLSEIEAAERKRKQEERARRRGGATATASAGQNDILAAAAVAAVHQFRANR